MCLLLSQDRLCLLVCEQTVVAAAVCHDKQIQAYFDFICFVGVGQSSDGGAIIRDLQASLHVQLTGKPLDVSLTDERTILQVLSDASKATNVLLVIDDAWEINQVKALACIDTTRYANHILATYEFRATARACAHRVLARVAVRGGRRAEAEAIYQSGAAAAMAGNMWALAWLIGRECGGNVGQSIIDDACTAIGKPYVPRH
jgi:hypothetical protein